MSAQAVSSREAFRAFLALIDEVDRDFLSEERRVTDPADVAEGEHMLLHLVKATIDVQKMTSHTKVSPTISVMEMIIGPKKGDCRKI